MVLDGGVGRTLGEVLALGWGVEDGFWLEDERLGLGFVDEEREGDCKERGEACSLLPPTAPSSASASAKASSSATPSPVRSVT